MRLLSILIRLLLAALIAPALLLVALAAPASAAAPPGLHAGATTAVAVAFTLDGGAVVQLLVAFVLPVLVGLVTTRATSAGLKAWLLAGLTLVTSGLTELGRVLASGGTFDIGSTLLVALPAFVVSVATHYGLWKPTGIAGAVQDVGASPSAKST